MLNNNGSELDNGAKRMEMEMANERVPGTKPYADGSCRKKGSGKKKKKAKAAKKDGDKSSASSSSDDEDGKPKMKKKKTDKGSSS